eukprot:CAMPEP_0184487188 /NCGR_PEP_ID=MMETSP0113_2-20130426/9440_1 /TAXON_ID=91329 /ORGANISM="Norrisiella sphaerica, Strain BC52" /LENGTH=144 /DNA_ID=CAMNT_0026869389 /DNA_START=25 /DNA_END=457 /DNA_ORIENTATION=+
MASQAFWSSGFNGRVAKTYRKLLQEMRRKEKDNLYIRGVMSEFRRRKNANEQPSTADRQLQRYAEDYATLLSSLNTYEQLLKEEGWGENKPEMEKVRNLAKHCGLQIPEVVVAKDTTAEGVSENLKENIEATGAEHDMIQGILA